MTGGTPEPYEVADYGDAGLLITFRQQDPDERWRAARTLQSELLAHRGSGVVDVVASFQTAFVSFDPGRLDHTAVRDLIGASTGSSAAPTPSRLLRIPTVYGGEHGPDLAGVAAELGLSEAALVELHGSAPWTVRLCGSPVAAPMTDGPLFPAAVARNPTPRTSLAAGSVAISGHQCMVYPVVSPGGWRLLGRTPVRLFELTTDALTVPYRPGDRFVFFPIDADAWDDWAGVPLVAEST